MVERREHRSLANRETYVSICCWDVVSEVMWDFLHRTISFHRRLGGDTGNNDGRNIFQGWSATQRFKYKLPKLLVECRGHKARRTNSMEREHIMKLNPISSEVAIGRIVVKLICRW